VALVLIPFRSLLHMTTDDDRLRALGAAHALLRPGGRLVFDVFAPSRDDVEDTHGRWLEREPGIFERADWDEGARTLTLSVRRGEEASTMLLAWLSPPEWRLLLDRAGFDLEAQWGWFDRRPYSGGEDVVFAARCRE
jgi:SAM-dependent methyltransferase